MEAEAFPIGFTKGIRSYWRSRKNNRADGGAARRVVRLGDGGSGGGGGGKQWAVRLGGMFRKRVQVPAVQASTAVVKAPARALGQVRDAYVAGMIGAARKQSAAALSMVAGTETLWQKRVPVGRSRGQRQARRQKPEELGQRLVLEMYKSVRASRELSGMLQASGAR